jgi:predicted transcriptional regulator
MSLKLTEVVEKLQLDVRTGRDALDVLVNKGYASDLMSDVIANTNEQDIWVTLQTHQNIVAVAVMKSLAGILLVKGRQPDEATVEKAEAENIPIMISDLPAFELVGRLYQMGITGV